MKRLFTALVLLILPASAAFCLTNLEDCQQKARQNYPQIKQFELLEKSREFNLSNINKAYLPQFNFSARATYQSDAIQIDMPVSPTKNISIHQSKDQYQATLEMNQLVWDGGTTSAQKKILKASSEIDRQKLDVELYTITDRVNQLYFGLLLLDEQLIQNDILQKELTTNFDKVKAYIKNGVANQADLDAVRLEQLNNSQKRTELLSAQKSYREMLSAMTGEALELPLGKPLLTSEWQPDTTTQRPEFKLFESQLQLLDNQSQLVQTGLMPKLGLFLQGGVGKPGMNMLSSEFSPYYIGGLRLSWNIGGFYTQKNTLNNLDINRELVSNQRATFLFNNNLKISQQHNELDKIRALIKNDDEIIRLRTNVKKASAAKVENGVLTVNDLLREINLESLARQQKALHEIQLYLAIYNLKYSTNH